jgi:hypothetical protein
MHLIGNKHWIFCQPMGSGQRCWCSRNISGTQLNWCAAPGNYGEPFNAGRGVTQGGLLSLLMFNVCVDAIVCEWLSQTLVEEAPHGGLGDRVVKILVAFYVDVGLIASCDPIWLQESFDVLIGLFEWIGLFTNAVKTKAMVCIPGWIQELNTSL